MVLSDWLTIVFSTLGVLAGAGISWVFFRTQLLADFGSINEKLAEINITRDVDITVNPKLADISAELQLVRQGLDHGVLDKLDSIYSDMKEVKEKINIIDELGNSMDIASIKSTVEQLDGNLNMQLKKY